MARKVTRTPTSKRRAAPRKPVKRKAVKRKVAKRKAVNRKAVKREPAKRAAGKRRPAARSHRDAAIEAALAGVAHDVRTPLTGILALAELLASSDLGERERQWANAIKSGADHLAALTTLIVDAVREPVAGIVLRPEPFSPRRLAEAVGHSLSARATARGLASDISIARDLPAMASGDVRRLRGALENLADNAVKFTDRGGITFTVASEPAPRGRTRLVFTVRDSGIGLSKQDIARLFKPFAQASEAVGLRYGGAGLGLVFVKRIARAMGGDLAVTGKPGAGSAFRLTVLADPADPRGAMDVARSRSLKILCAEDNPYGRVIMNTILTELGHSADFVETGEAAVRAVERGGYDAVVMDVAMPVLDGVAATRRIRALPGVAGRIPIIGTSGKSDVADENAGRQAGMSFYFTKPVSPGRLAQALATL